MKVKNVFDTIFSMENLQYALEDASRGRRYHKDALAYRLDSVQALEDIREEIYNGTYSIEKYHIFYVYEPKKRMIMSISFKHRIVQWAIYRVINPLLVRGYIEDSYGCIPGRGALMAMQRLHGWLESSYKSGKQWFYLKLDISKYFYRVSHKVLKRILAKKIHDKRLLEVLFSIIDCDHTAFGLPRGKSPEDVPLEERIFDVGMPIGNLMSQVFANLYLNELDQFCKRILRIHKYIRYMDDIIILGDSKKQLHEWKESIEVFLKENLELDLNKKTCIRPITCGVEFVGYLLWPWKVILRKSTTLRIKRALKGVQVKYYRGDLTLKEATDTLNAYLGMLNHCDCEALIDSILENFVLTHERRMCSPWAYKGGEARQKEVQDMSDTETVLMLVEANRLMSEVIDFLYPIALQVMTIEEMERSGIDKKIRNAADLVDEC